MEHPFYVYTPRNIHGESLVRPDNGVQYAIRAVHTGKDNHVKESNFEKAGRIAAKLNDEHAASLYYAAGI